MYAHSETECTLDICKSRILVTNNQARNTFWIEREDIGCFIIFKNYSFMLINQLIQFVC